MIKNKRKKSSRMFMKGSSRAEQQLGDLDTLKQTKRHPMESARII